MLGLAEWFNKIWILVKLSKLLKLIKNFINILLFNNVYLWLQLMISILLNKQMYCYWFLRKTDDYMQ